MSHFLGLPELASVHGAAVDQIIILVHWLMLALFVGWTSYFFLALVKFRKGRNPAVNRAGPGHGFSYAHELAVAVIEIVLLVAFSIPIYNQAVAALPPPEEAVVVRVVGEQFAWNIHYPGSDGIFGTSAMQLIDPQANPLGLDRASPGSADDIVTLNQLHLPVDKPVIVKISSKDVIHSFKLPEMRITQDAIPGQEVSIWFEPIKKGNWNIACAQLCGVGHSQMRGFITVESEEEFNAWLAQKSSEQQPTTPGSAEEVW